MIDSAAIRLRTSRSNRPVSWLELFFDLIFVAAVAQVGEPLAHEYTAAGLIRYTFLFLLIWWAWLGHTMFATRFHAEDTLQRVITLAQVFAAAVMAANAKEALGTRDAAGFAAAYAVMRILLVLQYMRARKVLVARRLATLHVIGYGTAALVWLGSALVGAPERFYFWAVALAIDLATPMFSVHYTHKLPPDAAHIPERHGLFTIILIGESVTAVMRGIESQEGWTVAAASAAILGLCTAFLYWWWYFNHNGEAERRKLDSNRSSALFFAWSYLHFPFCLGVAVTGLGIKHTISLMGGEHMGREGLWILLIAASLAMLSMAAIAMTTNEIAWKHKRNYFLAIAAGAAPLLVGICPGRAHESLVIAYLALVCGLAMRISARAQVMRSSKAAAATLSEALAQ